MRRCSAAATRRSMLANPISADLDVMRPSLLPNLLLAAQAQRRPRRSATPALFEVGPQYRRRHADGPAPGRRGPAHRRSRPAPLGCEAARRSTRSTPRAMRSALLAALGADDREPAGRGRGAGLVPPGPLGRAEARAQDGAGAFRRAPSARCCAALDVKGPAVGFELFLDALPAPKAQGLEGAAAAAALRLPAGRARLRLRAGCWSCPPISVIRAAKSADKALVAAVACSTSTRARACRTARSRWPSPCACSRPTRTLTDAEIEAVGQKIVAAVTKATGASLRS